jgi:hypothetical protein
MVADAERAKKERNRVENQRERNRVKREKDLAVENVVVKIFSNI